MSYQVRLTVFEGPLDLLLQLIERRELDITTISLAAVTDQYLEYISLLDNLELDILTDFLVVAAKLILIKSQALLPRPPAENREEEEDIGQDLVRQLQEYKRFKEVAEFLKERDEQGLHSYMRLATTGITPRIELEGVSVADLVDAMRRVLAALPEENIAPMMEQPLFTVAEKILVIEKAITQGIVRFHSLLTEARSRAEAIVTFLALLELIKQGRVVVQQTEIFGEIVIGPQLLNDVATATVG